MKRILSFLITVLFVLVMPCAVSADTSVPVLDDTNFDTYSQAYVVIDASTGQVLLEKNMNSRMYPASITKIMTCALALERADLTDRLVMSEYAVSSVARSSSHIALTAGEEISVEDAVMATQLASANDAANGIAEHIGGSVEMFCALMNKTARQAGAHNTNFTNANGLEDENHYTTAYDMAMITRYALSVEGFREVFGAADYTMQSTNNQPEQRFFGTQHHMIVYSYYQYKGAWGGKLGWTPQANHTAVTVAKRDGKELVCVVMDSKTKWEKYKDTKKLLDYCFNNLQTVTVSAQIERIKNIPVIDGTSVVGVARLPEQAVSYQLFVPEGVTQQDIDVSYNTKISYAAGEQITPEVCFRIAQDAVSTDIYAAPLACEVIMDDSQQSKVLSATEVMAGVDEENIRPARVTLPVIIASVLVGLLLLFMLLRVIVQWYYRRKRTKIRKLRY